MPGVGVADGGPDATRIANAVVPVPPSLSVTAVSTEYVPPLAYVCEREPSEPTLATSNEAGAESSPQSTWADHGPSAGFGSVKEPSATLASSPATSSWPLTGVTVGATLAIWTTGCWLPVWSTTSWSSAVTLTAWERGPSGNLHWKLR